jgi:hypothetical protein
MNSAERRDAALLDDYLGRLQRGEGGVDDVSREQPDAAARLDPLLQTAMRVRAAAPAGGLPAQARAAGEARLRAGLRRRVPAPASPGARSRPRLLRPAFVMFSLVAVIAILASGSGVAYASESSLPGDGLYPVKRAVESLRLAVSLTPEGDAGLLLEMAETRLSEVSRLSDLDREDDLPAALAGYDQAVGQLLGLARGWPSEADQADLDKLQTRLARHAQVLSALQSKAPQTAQDGLRNALQRSTERQKEVKELMELRGKKPGSLPRGSPSTTPSPVDDVKDRGEGKGPKEDRGPSSKAPPGQMTKTPKPES